MKLIIEVNLVGDALSDPTSTTSTGAEFDTMATYDIALVTSADLRSGMVLVDEYGLACAKLVRRVGSIGRGIVEWEIEDVDKFRLRRRFGVTGSARTTFAVSLRPNIKVAKGVTA